MKITVLDKYGCGFKTTPRKPHRVIASENKSVIKYKRPKPKNIVIKKSIVKPKKIMKTKKGSEVLEKLLTDNIIYVEEVGIKKKYLQNMIYDMKCLGHEIKPVRKGCATVAYQLIEQ